MKGLKETLASLSALRSRFERRLFVGISTKGRRHAGPRAICRHEYEFGSNPGNLRMLSHVPQGLPKKVR